MAACRADRESDLAALTDLPPFRSLHGITLGMQATAFHATRPAVTFVPSVGYREQIDGFVVAYGFGEVPSDISESAVLRYVSAARTASTPDEARDRWRALVGRMRERLGPPSSCWSDRPLSMPRHTAAWTLGDVQLQLSYLVPRAGQNEPGEEPGPRVQFQAVPAGAAPPTTRILERCG